MDHRRLSKRGIAAGVIGVGGLIWMGYGYQAHHEAAATSASTPAVRNTVPAVRQETAPVASTPDPSPVASGCGTGRSGRNISTPAALDAWNEAMQDSLVETRRAVVNALLANPDSEKHAAGLLLDATTRDRVASCPNGEDECIATPPQQEDVAARAASTDALATLARDTRSAQVYVWALLACHRPALDPSPPPPACAGLSTERWAELAPGSVWPWLALAGEAMQHGDPAGEETAMLRAAQADDWRDPGRGLERLILEQLPLEVQGLPRMSLPIGEVGRLALAPGAGTGVIARYCPSGMDANRRQVCTRLAEQALDHADDLLVFSVASRVAGRTDVPSARVAAVSAESDALRNLQDHMPLDHFNPLKDCVGIERQVHLSERRALVGELAAYREWRRDAMAGR